MRNYSLHITSITSAPFGSHLIGRTYQAESLVGYRFGYQSSLKDDQIKGTGNSYYTLHRELETRVGRWWSIDPKPMAGEGGYCSMSNNPILGNDPLGDVVTYGSFKDRVNTLIGRVFSKSFRDKYKAWKTSPFIYHIQEVANSPRLKDAAPVNQAVFGVPTLLNNVDYALGRTVNIPINIDFSRQEKASIDGNINLSRGQTSVNVRLRRPIPNTPITLHPGSYPSNFNLNDQNGNVVTNVTLEGVNSDNPNKMHQNVPGSGLPPITRLAGPPNTFAINVPANTTSINGTVNSIKPWPYIISPSPVVFPGQSNPVGQTNDYYRIDYTRTKGVLINTNINFTYRRYLY